MDSCKFLRDAAVPISARCAQRRLTAAVVADNPAFPSGAPVASLAQTNILMIMIDQLRYPEWGYG